MFQSQTQWYEVVRGKYKEKRSRTRTQKKRKPHQNLDKCCPLALIETHYSK